VRGRGRENARVSARLRLATQCTLTQGMCSRQGHYGIAPRRQSRGGARRVPTAPRPAVARGGGALAPPAHAPLPPNPLRARAPARPRPCAPSDARQLQQARSDGAYALVAFSRGAVRRQAAEPGWSQCARWGGKTSTRDCTGCCAGRPRPPLCRARVQRHGRWTPHARRQQARTRCR